MIVLLRREELEYDMNGDEEKYVAAPINRFRRSWYVLHLLHSFWRVTETTASIHTFLKTPGAFGYARAVADVTPEMLSEAMVKNQKSGGQASIHSLLADKDLPKQVHTALTSMHQPTASVVGSDGHRRLLQKEGVAYTLRFGPALDFITPNLADTKQPLLLIVQGEEFRLDEPVPHTYREMVQRLASDPVGQAFVFDLMMRLFFETVLGVRRDLIGRRRNAAPDATLDRCHDGCAAADYAWSFVGPVAAAFGAVEAQGRGSLHPHILVWLVQLALQDILAMLQRSRAEFKELIAKWMHELVQAIASVQHTAVSELPRFMYGRADNLPVTLPSLPFGPNEQRHLRADGEREQATSVEVGGVDGGEDRELFYYCPDREGGEPWQAAFHAKLPLRSQAGEAVDSDTWQEQNEAEKEGLWARRISAWASGTLPGYRLSDAHGPVAPGDSVRRMDPQIVLRCSRPRYRVCHPCLQPIVL